MPSCRRCCQAAYAARVDEDIDPYNLLRTSIPGGDHLHRTRRPLTRTSDEKNTGGIPRESTGAG